MTFELGDWETRINGSTFHFSSKGILTTQISFKRVLECERNCLLWSSCEEQRVPVVTRQVKAVAFSHLLNTRKQECEGSHTLLTKRNVVCIKC